MTKWMQLLPIVGMIVGASLLTHGLLGYSEATRIVFKSANNNILQSVSSTKLVIKQTVMTSILSTLGLYAYERFQKSVYTVDNEQMEKA